MCADYADRVGDYIVTFTGKRFYPLDVRPGDIVIEDVAHHLALCNRFAGATRDPVSVAQHSYYVSLLVEAAEKFHGRPGLVEAYQALHHDDSEAYMGDVTRPLKRCGLVGEFCAVDTAVQQKCYNAFGCLTGESPTLQWADDVMLHFEAEQTNTAIADVMRAHRPVFESFSDNVLRGWFAWTWSTAECLFSKRHRELRTALSLESA